MSILFEVLDRIREVVESNEPGIRYNGDGEVICYYCGALLEAYRTAWNHIIPRARGGEDKRWNLVLACDDCNARKWADHPLDWSEECELTPDVEVDFMARLLVGVYLEHRETAKTRQLAAEMAERNGPCVRVIVKIKGGNRNAVLWHIAAFGRDIPLCGMPLDDRHWVVVAKNKNEVRRARVCQTCRTLYKKRIT